MLTELRIKNYALIDDLEIEYSNGLNVLTGETGAGKSIVIGALSLLLGERAESDMIRTGTNSCEIEGTFIVKINSIENFKDLPIDETNTIIIHRKIENNGRSSCYINDRSVTINTLKRLGDLLVDLHGQHEHQSLLRIEFHRQILDDFAKFEPKRQELSEIYHNYFAQKAELDSLTEQIQKRKERRTLDEFQYQEISAAQLKVAEVETLLKEKTLLESAEKRFRFSKESCQTLSENEGSLLEQLDMLQKQLNELTGIDDSLTESLKELKTARSVIDELWRNLVKYQDRIEFSPQRLEIINERLFLIEKLKKKYSRNIEELLVYQNDLEKNLSSIEIDESRIAELKKELELKENKIIKQAKELSRGRQQAKKSIESKLVQELCELGMPQARFIVSIELIEDETGLYEEAGKRYQLDENGIDQVEFLFSANPGEEPKPLRKIASGGELSRIMLALKSITASRIPILVFDEIDLGIGGRVAEAVGKKLVKLSRSSQVICITHLPQIAKYAESHFRVSKSTKAGRTRTSLLPLSESNRIDEIARMLAGTKISKTTISHARELLKEAKT
jgi:DNA repair protein RecN (Recombination protein N)